MFDFAKLRIRRGHYRRSLRVHPLLRWHQRTPADGHTPVYCTHVASWCGWTFYANNAEVMEVRGSFHQHYHCGTNWRPYTFQQFTTTVADLCDAFGMFAGELRIVNLEIGINVRPPIPAVDLLPLFIFHHKKLPERMNSTDRGIFFLHPGRYRMKFYDKGHQFPEAGNLLRVEIHVDRMTMLHPSGIRTVEDLTHLAIWEAALQFLLKKVDEVFIAEPLVALKRLRPIQRALVEQATDGAHWMAQSPKKRHRKRRRIEGIYQRHATRNLKAELRDSIERAAHEATSTASHPVGGDERRTLDELEVKAVSLGVTFDGTRAHTPVNTRVIRHHHGGTPLPAQHPTSL